MTNGRDSCGDSAYQVHDLLLLYMLKVNHPGVDVNAHRQVVTSPGFTNALDAVNKCTGKGLQQYQPVIPAIICNKLTCDNTLK